ncbi:MAG TPA: cyanophycin synthetase [Dehalococcoidia bacterium]|nr:cyanophycin synthetase [Dehalococcoidia bacterium]
MNPNPVHVVSYGLSPASDWIARDINKIERQKGIDTSSFMVEFQEQAWGRFETQLPGVHNVLNSLGAIAVGHALGLDHETIGSAVAGFRGVHRRFELIGEAAGVTVLDDYAHHPTEVRATLAAARARFPERRIVCLFQPHTFSRTSFLLDDFRTCFAGCDALYLADTYAAREQPAAGMSAEQLAREVQSPPARYAGSVAGASGTVAADLRPGDVFFTIGAGDVNAAGPLVLEALRNPRGRGGEARE